MKRTVLQGIIVLLLLSPVAISTAFAETAEEFFAKGQAAYNNGQLEDALGYYKQAAQANPNYLDAYFNQGALYFNLKKYPEALEAFTTLLQKDPTDKITRYEMARVYEKLGRLGEAIAELEKIDASSPRYAKALENIERLKALKSNPVQTASKAGLNNISSTSSSQAALVQEKSLPKTTSAASKPNVQEFVNGFSGPTGVAVDEKGFLYVANFSKNSIYKVTPSGEKRLLASGVGINGPVGMAIDTRTGDLYIANHLDNTVSRINPEGKVTIVATGLKKPYNIFLDETNRTLFVSQQETNSVAKIKLY